MSVPPGRDAGDGPRGGGVIVFLVVTFTVTWAIWAPMAVAGIAGSFADVPLIFFAASFGPLCGAAAASLWEGGLSGLAAWARCAFGVRFARVWWIAALGMPLAYAVVGWLAAVIVTGSGPDPAGFGATEKLPGWGTAAVALTWLLTFGLGEEAGWRGWLLPALCRRRPPVIAATVVGLVWAGWHLPAFFFNPTYTAMGWGVIGWVLGLLAGSYLLSWMTIGARWSILPVVIWHGGFDLLTASDTASGVVAATISTVVMAQGVLAAVLLARRGRRTVAAAR